MRRLSINLSNSALFPSLLRTMSNRPPRRTLGSQWKSWEGRMKATWEEFRSQSSSPQPLQSVAQASHEGSQVAQGDPPKQTPLQPIQHNRSSAETPPSSAHDPEVSSTLSFDRIYLSPSSITEQQEAVNVPNFRELSNAAHVPERSQPSRSVQADAVGSPLPVNTPSGK